MNNDMHDEKLSSLYREAAREEPPMQLDSAILSEARKVVEKKSWWQRAAWVAPLATAAVAMLTVSLVMQMQREHPETMAPASVEEAVPAFQSNELKKELRQREETDAMKRKSTAPAPASLPAMRLAPSAAGVAEPKQEFMDRSQMLEPSPERGAGVGSAASMADKADETMAAQESEATLPPEEWIAKIRELLKQGKKEKAEKEIEAFKATWPGYELPDDLK